MKYFCRSKNENDYFGTGDSIEEAWTDYLNATSDELDFKSMEWFELRPISVKLIIELSKTTTTAKAKK